MKSISVLLRMQKKNCHKGKTVTRNQDSVKQNQKNFYRYAKYEDEISELIEKDGHLTKNDVEAAALLDKYVASVFTRKIYI